MAENQDGAEKTEEATPRRREEAREKGQVAISTELIAAVGLLVGLLFVGFGGAYLMETVGTLAVSVIGSIGPNARTELTVPVAATMIEEVISKIGAALAVVLLPVVAVSGLVGYAQIGVQFAGKAIELDPNKLNPVSGLKRLFGLRAVVRTGMSALKISLIGVTVMAIAYFHVDDVVRLGVNELGPVMLAMGHVALRCTIGAVVVALILAVIDLFYQRFQLGRDLRMTKKEVKDEHKLSEGDPHVKARIRTVQREMANNRMMQDVPDATVVVTNPTHYAVALKYESDDPAGTHDAPVVVAKGVDHLAQRIKKVADEAGVVLYEDVALARALHAQVEVGQEIPHELYSAVATVLGYVYRMQEASA